MAERRFVSHAEAREIFRKAGFADEKIEEMLRDLPDPIDTERHRNAFLEHGITLGWLMDRMGSSP